MDNHDNGLTSEGAAVVPLRIAAEDEAALRRAVELLENPGFIARVSDFVGTPIEVVLDRLPVGASSKIDSASRHAMRTAVNIATSSLNSTRRRKARNRFHLLAAGTAGAVGGAFGLASLAVELPITTTIILRSVADVARSEGEDLRNLKARLACLEVFAYGGRNPADDAAESGYFAVRTALGQAVSEATRYLGQKAAVGEGAPIIARLLSRIAARFNSVVAEKIVAQGVPIVGALGGAAVNMMFIRHFQDMARGHFIVRRLERSYPEEVVRQAYDRLLRDNGHSR
ncbi:MAG: EcsC family protein [Thermoanaerobaculales bacterium]|nr:EcsC family protein [Thermoanaerobaculales bacterium]